MTVDDLTVGYAIFACVFLGLILAVVLLVFCDGSTDVDDSDHLDFYWRA